MRELLTQTFKVYGRQDKLSESGKPVYFANPILIQGRLEHKLRIVKKPTGEEIQTDAVLYVLPNLATRNNYKVIDSDGNEYRIYSVDKVRDEKSVHHFEITLQLLTYA